MTEEEIWKTIPHFPDYEASSMGAIRRTEKTNVRPARYVMRARIDCWGYQTLGVRKNKKTFYRQVHRLVNITFNGWPPSPLHESAHNDGNQLNNAASNLRWATRLENIRDKVRHGTNVMPSCQGSLHHNAVLTEAIVIEMRSMRRAGWLIPAIAKHFGAAEVVTWSAVTGARWKHVPDPVPTRRSK